MNKIIPIIAAVVLSLAPAMTMAQDPCQAAGIDCCPLPGIYCPGGNTDTYILTAIINAAKFAFPGLLFAMFVFYGFKLIAGADNESTVSEVKNAYGYALAGTALALGAFFLARSFATPGELVDTSDDGASFVIGRVALVLKLLIFAALLFNIFFQAFRLITSQSGSQADQAKKQFVYGMVGAVIVILADRIVATFIGRNIAIASREAVGIANFLATLFGGFTLVALIVSGIFMVISVDESFKDKAKRIFFGALILLAVVMASYALISFAIAAPSGNAG